MKDKLINLFGIICVIMIFAIILSGCAAKQTVPVIVHKPVMVMPPETMFECDSQIRFPESGPPYTDIDSGSLIIQYRNNWLSCKGALENLHKHLLDQQKIINDATKDESKKR